MIRRRETAAPTPDDLISVFDRMDEVLHQAGHPREFRYSILFKLLLVKILREQCGRCTADSDAVVLQAELESALTLYAPLLPDRASNAFGCSDETLLNLWRALSSISVVASSQEVLQDFFMYFGRSFLKVDLAQYFTPCELIRFIVMIVSPTHDDRIIDPACGTADFLVAAEQVRAARHGVDASPQLHGADISDTAVKLASFNMLLNGCQGAKIECRDSLQDFHEYEGRYTLALCNPPFGTRLLERRPDVLARFDLARGRTAQETGLLFVEVCVRSITPGGRAAIILPNGYLGNRGDRYVEFRRWLLCNARLAAVIGFPRFTFKRSGADVSASVVVLERRESALCNLSELTNYPIHFNLIERVGWDLQSNRARRVFTRDPKDGAPVLDSQGHPMLDTDFPRVLSELYATSCLIEEFPWLTACHSRSTTRDRDRSETSAKRNRTGRLRC